MPSRQTALIDTSFKLKFGVKLCFFIIAGVIGLALLLYSITPAGIETPPEAAVYSFYTLKIELMPLIFASLYAVFMLAVITAGLSVISILFSHKIAGPMYRIQKNLESIGSGDLTVETKFRGNDQLNSLAAVINSLVSALNGKTRKCNELLSAIKDSEDRITELMKKGSNEEELRNEAEKMKKAVSELKAFTGAFR